jgi:hypothetical protein
LGIVLFFYLVYKFRRIIKRWSLYQKIQHLVEGFRDGLKSLRRVEKPWLLFLDTVLIWLDVLPDDVFVFQFFSTYCTPGSNGRADDFCVRLD